MLNERMSSAVNAFYTDGRWTMAKELSEDRLWSKNNDKDDGAREQQIDTWVDLFAYVW